jgi:hypothetical protein
VTDRAAASCRRAVSPVVLKPGASLVLRPPAGVRWNPVAQGYERSERGRCVANSQGSCDNFAPFSTGIPGQPKGRLRTIRRRGSASGGVAACPKGGPRCPSFCSKVSYTADGAQGSHQGRGLQTGARRRKGWVRSRRRKHRDGFQFPASPGLETDVVRDRRRAVTPPRPAAMFDCARGEWKRHGRV